MKPIEMKKHFKPILPGLLAFAICINASAQTPPKLELIKDSPTSAQINWTNQVGTSYRLWFTESLAPSAWTPWADAFSEDTNVVVSVSTTETPAAFFRVQIPTNGTLPAVQIFSPTNNQTVSGEIAVRIGAQLGVQVQGVNLYLDDALVGYLNSGGMKFDLDTTHFANGSHTLYVGAVDTANNETLSSSITLDFDNPVRWLDASSMFNSFVPIDVESDIYPADWLVSVMDTNGIIVRTITGSTSDGIIQTSWDGTDENSQPLPVENLYQITVDVTETSGSSMMMATSFGGALGATSVSSKTNPYGVPEYTVQQSAPNPLTAYLETLKIYEQLSEKERLIYPPLPARPLDNPNATVTVKMSAREAFLASHTTTSTTLSSTKYSESTASANASATPQSGSTKTLVWWENPWGSGQIVLARVPIPGINGTKVENNFNQIAVLVGTAEDTVGYHRSVYGGYVQVVSSGSDVTQLKNNLNVSSVRALYFYGHGNTNGNVFGTTTSGISAKELATLFGNYYIPSLPASYGALAGKQAMITQKGFSFIFLDGCNTALGDLPEAFGIPKKVSGAEISETSGHVHKRAFLGWTGPVTFQFGSDHIDWSFKFWTVWMNGGDADVSVTRAIELANDHRPSVLNDAPIERYGNGSLKWSD